MGNKQRSGLERQEKFSQCDGAVLVAPASRRLRASFFELADCRPLLYRDKQDARVTGTAETRYAYDAKKLKGTP